MSGAAKITVYDRLEWLDVARGMAIVLMVVYHFCYDLAYFGWLKTDFNRHLGWLSFRALIVSSFLVVVGVSLVLARTKPMSHYWKRIAVVAACALLVTLTSYLIFPRSFIYFGILHHIAVASVLAWPLRNSPKIALAVGVTVLIIGNFVHFELFDRAYWNWLGFAPEKPITEDYVPLFPWFGIVAIGVALGHLILAKSSPMAGVGRRRFRSLALLGRKSLLVYMIHQPILVALLWLVVLWR